MRPSQPSSGCAGRPRERTGPRARPASRVLKAGQGPSSVSAWMCCMSATASRRAPARRHSSSSRMRRARWAGANSMPMRSPPPASRSLALTAKGPREVRATPRSRPPTVAGEDAGTGRRRFPGSGGTSPARNCRMPPVSAASTLFTGSTHCRRASSTSARGGCAGAAGGRRSPASLDPRRHPQAQGGAVGLSADDGPAGGLDDLHGDGSAPRTRTVSPGRAGSQPGGPRASMPDAVRRSSSAKRSW